MTYKPEIWCHLGKDGQLHLDPRCTVTQPITISLPLGFVLMHRCDECGAVLDYEKACNIAAERAKWLVEHEEVAP